VNVYFEKNDSLLAVQPGDDILFFAGLDVPVNAGNPDEFDYAGYLRSHRIYHQAWVNAGKWKWLPRDKKRAVDMPYLMKRKLLQRIYDTQGDEDAKAVLAAITLGTRDYLDPELKSAWANAGGIHVMAVSGLHVGLIWMVLEWMTLFLRRRKSSRIIRFLVITMVLWFYAVLTGLSPSVTRSCLMFSLVSLGRLINRNSDTYNTVLVAAFIQLWIKPVLFFDAGFRFSYLAVLGILLFHNRLTSLITVKNLTAGKVRDLAAVSLSAQFLTFPLGIYYFHQFPTWFLLTNFFVIPLVTGLVMIYLLSVVCFFIPWASFITTKACILVATIMNHGIGFIEGLPGALIDGLSLNSFQVCLFIVLPLVVLAWITYRKPSLLIGAQCVLLAIIVTGIVRRSRQSVENALIVYNTRRLPSVSILSNGRHIVLTDTSEAGYRKSVEYAGAGFWVNHFMEHPDYLDLRTFDDRIGSVFRLPGDGNIMMLTPCYRLALISDCRVFSAWDTPKKFDVDFLVFTGPGIPAAEDTRQLFTPGCVILSSAVPAWKAWPNSGPTNPLRVVDVRRSGCFLFTADVKRQVKK